MHLTTSGTRYYANIMRDNGTIYFKQDKENCY